MLVNASRALPAFALLTLGGLLPHAASAQSPPPVAGAGIEYQSFRFRTPEAAGIERLSLLTTPFAIRLPLYRQSRLELRGTYARGSLERGDGTEAISLAAFTDTQLRLTVPLVGADVVTLGAILSLPTGQATLTGEEALLAGAVAADLLPFAVSHWGSGGGAGVSVGVHRALGAVDLRVDGSYFAAREFEPFVRDTFVYRPGDQLYLNASATYAISSSSTAELQVSAQHYGEDESGGSNLYQSGARYQAIGSYAFSVRERSSGILYVGLQHREEGSYLFDQFPTIPTDGLGETPSQNLFMAGLGARLSRGRNVWIPSVDARLLRRDDGIGQGHLSGVGIALERRLGHLTLVPSARARFGYLLVREDTDTGLYGADLGLSMRWGGLR